MCIFSGVGQVNGAVLNFRFLQDGKKWKRCKYLGQFVVCGL